MHLPALIVEVAFPVNFSDGPFLTFDDPTRGRFDVAKFAPDVVWQDVSAFVRELSLSRGVSRHDPPYRRAEAGTCTIVLDNTDDRFSPVNLLGPYTEIGISQVLPRKEVRVIAVYDGVRYPLWRGFANSWNLEYPLNGKDATCTLECTDLVQMFAGVDRAAVTEEGLNERVADRLERVVNSAGVDADGYLLVEDTDQVSDPKYDETALSGDTWAEIQLTSDVSFGELWVDAEGHLRFRHRNEFATDPSATFGPDDLAVALVTFRSDTESLMNDVRIQSVGIDEQSASDTTSQDLFGRKSHVRQDFTNLDNLFEDSYALNFANMLVAFFAYPTLRFDTIQFDPRVSTTHVVTALTLDFGDRVEVAWQPPGALEVIEGSCFVRGVTHEFTPGSWSYTLALEDATLTSVMVADHPAFGRCNFNYAGL